ncbi:UNVERIFIED_CONTAM: hypothetical protein PYX00_008532 [Menopon gallinae]|uniref:thioredoxin-disulfide reductase (NADPH) n=1 Tax=Menopon gallinae TaxID=328185 RepID=A0AAW2HPS0_9NEOP
MINTVRFISQLSRLPRNQRKINLFNPCGRCRDTQKVSDGGTRFSFHTTGYSPSKNFLKSVNFNKGSYKLKGPETMSETKEISYAVVEKCRQLITESRVVVFSKTTCPYCKRVKKLFATLGEEPVVYELDKEADGPLVQEYLFQTTSQKTVPNVFVNSRHVGGCDDTFRAYGDGSLCALLQEPPCISPEEKVDTMLEQNIVVIFSKTNCPFCLRVKALFTSLNVTAKIYELDEEEDGPMMQEYLFERTKQRTVPNVFVRKNHIGGCDDTMKAFGNGSLQALLSTTSIMTPDEKIHQLINENNVVIFVENGASECGSMIDIFDRHGIQPVIFVVGDEIDGKAVQERLIQKTQESDMPKVFIQGVNMGGPREIQELDESGKLSVLVEEGSNEIDEEQYDYDLIVIGGGSGGLAAAKEAAMLGKKVALCDFVVPSPLGTTWGLGGTCVNVGCIPKKLMHQAAIHYENMHDSACFGWNVSESGQQHKWELMVENIQNYIKSLNFGYRKELNKRKVKYYNAFAEFLDSKTVKITHKNGKVEELKGRNFIIAVGGRPAYPDIPGAREYCITSDDLFSLKENPGKTLIIGASYIALECGGFLAGLKFDVTIMVRSILLRGFDRQMAELIGEHMENHGVKFLREYVPVEVKKDELGKLKVTAQRKCGEEEVFYGFDTVILAIGREACTDKLGLHNLPSMKVNPRNKKIIVDGYEKSSVPNIYAIGDVIDGKPELTPVAIHAGRYLGQRLAGIHRKMTNYKLVPTTVFTPLEYGCVGMSEEEAHEVFGEKNVIVYHNSFKPLEHALSREETVGYAKLICVKTLNSTFQDLVVGFHILSPNAGEITQGFAIGLKMNATKTDFDDLIGIHPTCAEVFTTLYTVKNPGDKPPETTGC